MENNQNVDNFVTEVKYLKCIFSKLRRINIFHESFHFLWEHSIVWYRVYSALNSVFFVLLDTMQNYMCFYNDYG